MRVECTLGPTSPSGPGGKGAMDHADRDKLGGLSRRALLRRALVLGGVAGAGLLAACQPTAPTAPTAAPTSAPPAKPAAAPTTAPPPAAAAPAATPAAAS